MATVPPEEDRRTASVVPSDVYASQRGLSSGVINGQERSDSDPPEAASGTLPGFSELGFVGLDKSSPWGGSTPPSTASQAPSILSPSDLLGNLPKSLLWNQGLNEFDRHKTYKVVSSQRVNFPDHVPMSKGQVGRTSGTPTVRPTLRQDLASTLPAWAQARLGASSSTSQQPWPLPSDSLGFTDSSSEGLQPSMPAQIWGLGFPISEVAQAMDIESSQPLLQARVLTKDRMSSDLAASVRDTADPQLLGPCVDSVLLSQSQHPVISGLSPALPCALPRTGYKVQNCPSRNPVRFGPASSSAWPNVGDRDAESLNLHSDSATTSETEACEVHSGTSLRWPHAESVAQAQNSSATHGRQGSWVARHEPAATWFNRACVRPAVFPAFRFEESAVLHCLF